MITVNLLATTPGKPAPREWVPREQRSAVLGLSALLVTALGVGGAWYYLTGVKAGVDHRIAAAEAQMVRLKEAAKLVEKTAARKASLAERLAVIERLQTSKRAPVSLLQALSQSVPDGLWLLELKQTGASVQVDGRALSLSAVSDFTERMQNSGMFQRPVEILTTSTEAVEETTVVRFAVKGELVPLSPVPTAQAPSNGPTTVASAGPARTGA